MNMTYNEVQAVILEGINRNGGCFISAIDLLKVFPHFLFPGKNQRSRAIIQNDYKNA